jgi:YggT family protein
VTGGNIWWSYLYFHLPNYAMSVLFYTLWGRFAMSLFLPPDSPNYIFRWFRRLTDWFVGPVAFITPSAMPAVLLAPAAAFWMDVLRVLFFVAMYQAGLTPRMAPAAA